MKTKLVQVVPVLLALAGVGFLRFSLWCTSVGNFCYRGWLDQNFLEVVKPLYFFALYSLPLTIILIFVRRDIFEFWRRPAIIILVLSLGFIATTPVSSSALLAVTRDYTARVCAEVFTVISLILIAYKYFKTRKIRTS